MASERTEWLRKRLGEIDGDLDDARERGLATSLAAFHHQARLCRKEMDESIAADIEAAKAATAPAVGPAVSLADALAEARSLPIAERRALLREIAAGLDLGDGPALRVVSGG